MVLDDFQAIPWDRGDPLFCPNFLKILRLADFLAVRMKSNIRILAAAKPRSFSLLTNGDSKLGKKSAKLKARTGSLEHSDRGIRFSLFPGYSRHKKIFRGLVRIQDLVSGGGTPAAILISIGRIPPSPIKNHAPERADK